MEQVVKTPNNNNSKGKRKIPIELITNKYKKQVTFSKRRGGLFKKASELSSLCGSEVAILTFSGAGKFFGFGHPSVDVVVQRYINKSSSSNQHFSDICDSNSSGSSNNNDIGMFSQQYKDVISQIEVEKRARATTSSNININININSYSYNAFWWDENIDDLGLIELEHYKVALERLRNEVATRVDEINRPSLSVVTRNFDFGTRDGNKVTHCSGQGFIANGPSTFWIDNNTGGNFQPGQLSGDSSYLDMLMKVQT